jgi:hypothetical protein
VPVPAGVHDADRRNTAVGNEDLVDGSGHGRTLPMRTLRGERTLFSKPAALSRLCLNADRLRRPGMRCTMRSAHHREGIMPVSKDQLIDAVRKASAGGTLSCEQAHRLGKELGVSLKDIGAACNELTIKIKACQLGCF